MMHDIIYFIEETWDRRTLNPKPLIVIDSQNHVKLELMDVGSDGKCGQWGTDLPIRLKQLYSHWLCR